MSFTSTRKELFDILRNVKSASRDAKINHLKSYVINNLHIKKDEDIKHIGRQVTLFGLSIFDKYDKASRKLKIFLDRNEKWLNGIVKFSIIKMPNKTNKKGGRPTSSFENSTIKTKRRKASELCKTKSTAELSLALQMKLRSEGRHTAAKIVQEACSVSGNIPHMVKKNVKNITSYTDDEALALIVENKSTKNEYLNMRHGAIERGVDLYPSYHKILDAKTRCYPGNEYITVTDSIAEVKLQALLDHTATRIVKVSESVTGMLSIEQLDKLTLLSKWGFDGSSGHSQYKQKPNSSESMFSDSNLFVTSFVPLELNVLQSDLTKKIIWKNPRPSSTRFCRPIRIQLIKETTEVSKEEKQYIENQINNLVPSKVSCPVGDVSVTHKMALTMIDGKVCNAITSTASAQTCNICGATPKKMNNIQVVSTRTVDQCNLQFGLSSLHAWIRFFELLLHISYRLPIQKWQIRSVADKDLSSQRKKIIQNRFRSEMGLLIDMPIPGGSGTTNDGNTARQFFEHASTSSEITGIDLEVIKRFRVILQTISSGFAINVEAFAKYAHDTAELYVHKYNWYPMSASVHKVLVHGSDIIEHADLPIGELSEEAQEARNKDCKYYKEHNTRKSSRLLTNLDLLHMLLISSDPWISSLRRLPQKKNKSFSPEVLALLQDPQIQLAKEHSNIEYEEKFV